MIRAAIALLLLLQAPAAPRLSVGNGSLEFTFDSHEGRLTAVGLSNGVAKQQVPMRYSEGFLLGLGTPDASAPREWIALRDFVLKGWTGGGASARFDLENPAHEIACQWHWEAAADGPYLRSWLEIRNTGEKPLAIADVDVLALRSGEARNSEPEVAASADSDDVQEAPRTSAWSAIDADPGSHWTPARTGGPHWLQLTFRHPVEIGRVVVHADPPGAATTSGILIPDNQGRWARLERPATTTRLRVTAAEGTSIAELELYDAGGHRIPLLADGDIAMQRSGGIGYGEGVALMAGNSVFAALEALLYDYRLGVSRDGAAFRVGHNPGWVLQPGQAGISQKAVLGVGPPGEAGQWFMQKYLQPNWRQTRQGNRHWDRYWAYNITSDEKWSLGTADMQILAKALLKARQAYGFGFDYVGPDITALVSYDPYRLGLNRRVFPGGFEKTAEAIESTGAAVEGYYGIGKPEDLPTYKTTLLDLVERERIKMLVFDGYVSGYGGDDIYQRERVWDNFRETIETLQARRPDVFIGLESFSPNLLTRWVWVNTQFDHHASQYLKYNPDARLNNVRAELIPDAGAGSLPVLHGRDVVTASAGVYAPYGVPWRGVETFGPLWQLVYNPFYQGSSAMERSRDNWVLNLFGAATILSPVTYGRIFGQPPEDFAWLGRMLRLRDANLDVFEECAPKENGDIFHGRGDRAFAVFRNLRWEPHAERSFTLDGYIGLSARDREYVVRQVYPVGRVLTTSRGGWRWKFGERVRLTLDPFQLKMLYIGPAADWKANIPAGRDYEEDRGGPTLLDLPAKGPWYARLAALAPMPDRTARIPELLEGVDFMKATAYPTVWRESNFYGLLEYQRRHPYPYPEIEAARQIKLEPVYDSMKWFSDGDPDTPAEPTVPVTITHAPIVFGRAVIQADAGLVLALMRLRVAVRENLPALTASISQDGFSWKTVSLAKNGRYWDSGAVDERARYIRVDTEATATELDVFPKGAERPLDWSTMKPYPISFARSRTNPEQATDAWSASFTLPPTIYDGQQIALPLYLKEDAFVSEVWPLYRVGGERRGAYRVVPGYAKEAAGFWSSHVRGLTFRLPLQSADAGKRMEIVVVSAKPLARGDVWLVSDPLPYKRTPWRAR